LTCVDQNGNLSTISKITYGGNSSGWNAIQISSNIAWTLIQFNDVRSDATLSLCVKSWSKLSPLRHWSTPNYYRWMLCQSQRTHCCLPHINNSGATSTNGNKSGNCKRPWHAFFITIQFNSVETRHWTNIIVNLPILSVVLVAKCHPIVQVPSTVKSNKQTNKQWQ
jgi:hypothetical protein